MVEKLILKKSELILRLNRHVGIDRGKLKIINQYAFVITILPVCYL